MNEDEAFDLMRYVLYDCGLREQYKPDMEALQVRTKFRKCMHCYRVSKVCTQK